MERQELNALLAALYRCADVPLVPPVVVHAEARAATVAVIARASRSGPLAPVLGSTPFRVVQVGGLGRGGLRVGATALLTLVRPRTDVSARVPGATFTAPALRDLLVNVDLPSGTVVGAEPGPHRRPPTTTSRPRAADRAAGHHPAPRAPLAPRAGVSLLRRRPQHQSGDARLARVARLRRPCERRRGQGGATQGRVLPHRPQRRISPTAADRGRRGSTATGD